MIRFLLLITLLFICPSMAAAQNNSGGGQGRELPRFVSLASDKVFVRAGPGLRYPIKWIFQKEGLPVKIVQEFDTWRKIEDVSGDEGWIHQSLLRGRRSVIIQGDDVVLLLNKPDSEKGKAMARLEPNVVASLQECDEVGVWCKVSAQGYAGWIQSNALWGLRAD